MFPALFISISTLFPFLKFNCPEHHEYTLRLSTNQLFSYIFMDLYRSNKIELSSLTWSNSLYGDNQIVQFGPCNFLYDLAVLQDLEGRNHPDSQLLCQSLPTVLRWISVSSCICIRELGSGKDYRPCCLGCSPALERQRQDTSQTILGILEPSLCRDHTWRI